MGLVAGFLHESLADYFCAEGIRVRRVGGEPLARWANDYRRWGSVLHLLPDLVDSPERDELILWCENQEGARSEFALDCLPTLYARAGQAEKLWALLADEEFQERKLREDRWCFRSLTEDVRLALQLAVERGHLPEIVRFGLLRPTLALRVRAAGVGDLLEPQDVVSGQRFAPVVTELARSSDYSHAFRRVDRWSGPRHAPVRYRLYLIIAWVAALNGRGHGGEEHRETARLAVGRALETPGTIDPRWNKVVRTVVEELRAAGIPEATGILDRMSRNGPADALAFDEDRAPVEDEELVFDEDRPLVDDEVKQLVEEVAELLAADEVRPPVDGEVGRLVKEIANVAPSRACAQLIELAGSPRLGLLTRVALLREAEAHVRRLPAGDRTFRLIMLASAYEAINLRADAERIRGELRAEQAAHPDASYPPQYLLDLFEELNERGRGGIIDVDELEKLDEAVKLDELAKLAFDRMKLGLDEEDIDESWVEFLEREAGREDFAEGRISFRKAHLRRALEALKEGDLIAAAKEFELEAVRVIEYEEEYGRRFFRLTLAALIRRLTQLGRADEPQIMLQVLTESFERDRAAIELIISGEVFEEAGPLVNELEPILLEAWLRLDDFAPKRPYLEVAEHIAEILGVARRSKLTPFFMLVAEECVEAGLGRTNRFSDDELIASVIRKVRHAPSLPAYFAAAGLIGHALYQRGRSAEASSLFTEALGVWRTLGSNLDVRARLVALARLCSALDEGGEGAWRSSAATTVAERLEALVSRTKSAMPEVDAQLDVLCDVVEGFSEFAPERALALIQQSDLVTCDVLCGGETRPQKKSLKRVALALIDLGARLSTGSEPRQLRERALEIADQLRDADLYQTWARYSPGDEALFACNILDRVPTDQRGVGWFSAKAKLLGQLAEREGWDSESCRQLMNLLLFPQAEALPVADVVLGRLAWISTSEPALLETAGVLRALWRHPPTALQLRGGGNDDRKSVLRLGPGARVRHAQWGEGTVVGIEGAGTDTIVTVVFASVGLKQLSLRYAPLDDL